MRIRHSAACGSAIAAALVVATALTQGASKNFVPDVIFTGSSLSGWRPLGDAKWRAENGEIVAAPGGGSGWLILDKSYQDVAFSSEFRCAPGCTTGVLLRAEKTAGGGLKGIFVPQVEARSGLRRRLLRPRRLTRPADAARRQQDAAAARRSRKCPQACPHRLPAPRTR